MKDGAHEKMKKMKTGVGGFIYFLLKVYFRFPFEGAA